MSLLRNPLLLVLAIGAVWAVVLGRRTRAPWARTVGAYLAMAGAVLVIRMFFQVVMGVGRSGTVLFSLPEIGLPEWAAGIRLGGPVTAEALLRTFYESLRLVGILMCIGAANSLANPRRTLRNVPAALHQVSVAVVISLSVAPQLITSVQRVRRARRLRGGRSTGWGAVKAVVIPVLEDAIESSMQLAAGMESRGYGRTADPRGVGWPTTLALLASSMLVLLGSFLLLGVPMDVHWDYLCLATGVVLGGLGFRWSGRRLGVSRYRPDVWGTTGWLVSLAGLAAVAVTIWLVHTWPDEMNTPTDVVAAPVLTPAMLCLVAVLASPLATTRPPARDAT